MPEYSFWNSLERGGTDGARLSFMGLPCPNLGTGGYAFHGPYEHVTAEGMDLSVTILICLVKKVSEREKKQSKQKVIQNKKAIQNKKVIQIKIII